MSAPGLGRRLERGWPTSRSRPGASRRTARFARWSKRHRTLVTSASVAAAVGIVAVSYVFYQADPRQSAADGGRRPGRCALTTAEVRAIPTILGEVEPDRAPVTDRLRAIAAGDGSGKDHRRRLSGAGPRAR